MEPVTPLCPSPPEVDSWGYAERTCLKPATCLAHPHPCLGSARGRGGHWSGCPAAVRTPAQERRLQAAESRIALAAAYVEASHGPRTPHLPCSRPCVVVLFVHVSEDLTSGLPASTAACGHKSLLSKAGREARSAEFRLEVARGPRGLLVPGLNIPGAFCFLAWQCSWTRKRIL